MVGKWCDSPESHKVDSAPINRVAKSDRSSSPFESLSEILVPTVANLLKPFFKMIMNHL